MAGVGTWVWWAAAAWPAILISAMSTGAAAQAPVPPPAADTSGSTEAYRLIPDPTRLTLPVGIGEGGPYRFVVDTGAERTVISTALAATLRLAPGRPVRILTVAGATEVPTALIPQLRLGTSRSLRDVRAPTLSAAHIGADGMLGIDALRGRTVTFDFRGGAMSVTPALRRDRAPADPDEIVVTARTRRGRLILGAARVEQVNTAIVLDSGAEITIGNRALRDRLAARRRLGPITIGEIMTIAGERLTVEMVAIRALDIGGVTLRMMPIAFATSPIFTVLDLQDRPALLLGMDALRLFERVSVDFNNRKVRFLP